MASLSRAVIVRGTRPCRRNDALVGAEQRCTLTRGWGAPGSGGGGNAKEQRDVNYIGQSMTVLRPNSNYSKRLW